MKVYCTHCHTVAKLVRGKKIYPNYKKYHNRFYYQCPKCEAYVGTHKDSKIPLGTPANKELRMLRSSTHKKFDVIWKKGYFTRSQAYRWLADKLNIRKADCHIGKFDKRMCLRVFDIIDDKIREEYYKRRMNINE